MTNKKILFMNFIKATLITVLFFASISAYAQSGEGKDARSGSIMHTISPLLFERSTGTSGTGSNIDVIYHKIFWRLNPDSLNGTTSVKYIKGSVQFNFKTTQANVSIITFDLRSVLLLDSIRFRSNQFLLNSGYTRVGNIVTLNLGTSLPINFIDSFIVYYKGVPPAIAGAAQGFQLTQASPAGSKSPGRVLSTLSESYEDRDWWPCKADMQDKVDSMEINVSVPWIPASADTFWVATNGKMIDSSIVGNSRIFKFKTKYPIASYLVSVTVARFDRYYRSVNTGTTIVPVVYNLAKGASTTAAAVSAMDKVNDVLKAWTPLFGEYPFKLEKHGFSGALDGGSAMEHQTMSSMTAGSVSNIPVLIHELSHQWFGDNVGFAHWNDLWLAEGFAEYSDPLSKELVPTIGNAGSALSSRSSIKTAALGYTANSAWIPNSNSTTSPLIWSSTYGSTVYQRGAMIVSMLRTMSGDSIFFKTLTKYQTELAGKSVTADTLRNYFNRELGRDISAFFDDYVGGSDTINIQKGGIGHPTNTINWNNPTTYGQGGKRLVISVASQTKTATSTLTPYFRGPIQLHIQGSTTAQDTVITIFDWGNGNLSYAGKGISAPIPGNRITFDLSFIPSTIFYDDSSRTMSNGVINAKLTTLESNLWLGTTNTDWNTPSNWQSNLVPAAGADVTIATAVTNQPILPNNVTVGPLTILAANSVNLNGKAFTLNMDIRALGTGTFTGSSTSVINVETNAGEIRMDQTSASTRSLSTINMKPKSSATLGTGLIEIYNGFNLPAGCFLNVKTNGLLIR